MPFRNGLAGASPFPISRSDSAYMSPISQELSTGNPTPSPLQSPLPRLVIHPMPQKSRVETQIPLKITLHNSPRGIKKVHLPTHTISKPKLLQKPPMGPNPDTLELTTMLVCTSAMLDDAYRKRAFGRAAGRPAVDELSSPMDSAEDEENKSQNGGEVRICTGCITRERKRAGRKKHKKPEEDELWDRYERERAIVFNTQEVKEWQTVTLGMADPTGAGFISGALPEGTVQVDAPMRIACYCRHHGEKMGFQVIITLKDYLGGIVAQGMSSSIMITDDHKTPAHAGPAPAPAPVPASQPQPQHSPRPHSQPLISNGQSMASQTGIMQSVAPIQPRGAHTLPSPGPNSGDASLHSCRQTHSASDLQAPGQNAPLTVSVSPRANNPQPTPTSATPRNLSRQTSPASPLGAGGRKRKASIVPASLTMTKIEADQSFPSMGPNIHNDSTAISAANSPFLPSATHIPLNRDISSQGQQQMLGHIPQSFGPGTATPNNGRTDPFIFGGMNGRPMMLDRTVPQLFSAPPSAHPSRPPSPSQQLRPEAQSLNLSQHPQDIISRPVQLNPTILRVIPHEGSKCGGAEITVLGRDFVNDGLEVYFGSQKATTTTFWGPSSLVCMLPPSPVSGSVPVTIKQSGRRQAVQQSVLFTYKDDDEDQLIRSALGVLASQYGRMVTDPAEFARSILYSQTGASGSSGQTPHGNGGNNFTHFSLESGEAVESGLLRLLEMMDLGENYDQTRLNIARRTGQTMLHFACSLGFDRFVAGLLSRGANVHMQDEGGFTPLHMAAINDHAGIIRRLIARGADRNTESYSGLKPIDVARSSSARRILQQAEGHYRSRSTGWRPGRNSNSSSVSRLAENHPEFLASDFDPAPTVDGDDSSEVTTTDEDEDWSDMRRGSLVGLRRRSTAKAHVIDEADGGPASPNATMAAIREQIATQLQQFQHSMAMHLQNISQLQMPNIPQMPNLPPMPVLPDYQAYLQSAPVMQRISSLVPNMRTQRQETAGDHTETPGDNKWGVFPFFGSKDAPPAYEDIFPRGELDLKQSSAAQAAAEFEADAKCATLFDQTPAEASQTQEVPALLQIGRKHLITKEQQETLQRAHAQRLKAGSSDKMLWFVWVSVRHFKKRKARTNRDIDSNLSACSWSDAMERRPIIHLRHG